MKGREHIMSSKSKLQYISKYDKENCIRYCIKLNKLYDTDIIEALQKSGNKTGLIKESIRHFLKKDEDSSK